MKKLSILLISSIFLLFTAVSCNNDDNGYDNGNDTPRNGDIWNPDGIEMVFVEGTDTMPSFFIGRFEITQEQWDSVMDVNLSLFRGENLPVETVSWNDVQDFLLRLNKQTGRNYRLPTEFEWEFAARGGTATSFCEGGCEFSGSNDVSEVAWWGNNSGNRTHTVGTRAPNELGIHDMSGNVWEWTSTEEGSYRVLRGGSWTHTDLERLRVSGRFTFDPSVRNIHIGFRVVLP